MEDRRDLTQEEIGALSTELKACYLLQAWNVSANFKNVWDWIDSFWCFWTDEDDIEDVKESNARKRMLYRWTNAHNLLLIFGLRD